MKGRIHVNIRRSAYALAVGLIFTSCSHDDETIALASHESALRSQACTSSESREFVELASLPAGVAGDEQVVFVGAPLEGRVLVLSRATGRQLGELPAPPEGFILPFILHTLGPGRLGLLDAGGLPSPSPFVPANPTLYEYRYGFHPRTGFHAELTRTVSFASVTIGFAEDFVALADGSYVVSDAVLGALWVARRDGRIVPGIVPEGPSEAQAIPELRVCPTMPLIEVGGLPFLFSGSTLPGVSSLALRDHTLYFYSPCAEGLYSVPVASLFDRRAPHERAEDIELVSPKPRGIEVEQLLGLTFNPYDRRDRFLYAADSLQLRVVRIDPRSGERQVVDADPRLFNFPSSMAFVPSRFGAPRLLVVSNQQHRTPLTNDAIAEDLSLLPYVVTETSLRR